MKDKSKVKRTYEEKEAKYRHKINQMNDEIRWNKSRVEQLNLKISELEDEVRKRDDWIERLLQYMDLNEDEMKAFIKRTEDVERLSKVMHDIAGLTDCFSYLLSGRVS